MQCNAPNRTIFIPLLRSLLSSQTDISHTYENRSFENDPSSTATHSTKQSESTQALDLDARFQRTGSELSFPGQGIGSTLRYVLPVLWDQLKLLHPSTWFLSSINCMHGVASISSKLATPQVLTVLNPNFILNPASCEMDFRK